MSKKTMLIAIILFVIMLSACQEDDQTESNENIDQSNPLNSQEDDLDDQLDAPGDVSYEDDNNSDESPASDDSSPVKEESYPSEQEAVNAIEGYRKIEQTNIDLGNGIKGFIEGAAGHQYVSWNEGNWLIEIDFPSDPQYAVDDYENGESMAKSIVSYLEDDMLPPPSQRGVIKIKGFSDSPKTLIQWQQGADVYEIDQQTADPIEALRIAVDYQASNK